MGNIGGQLHVHRPPGPQCDHDGAVDLQGSVFRRQFDLIYHELNVGLPDMAEVAIGQAVVDRQVTLHDMERGRSRDHDDRDMLGAGTRYTGQSAHIADSAGDGQGLRSHGFWHSRPLHRRH